MRELDFDERAPFSTRSPEMGAITANSTDYAFIKGDLIAYTNGP